MGNKIESPEELDRRLVVVSSKSWLALALTCLLAIGAIFWAFFGMIPNTYEIPSIYLNTQGFEMIDSHFSGRVKEIKVGVNHEVTSGEILAIIEDKSGQNKAILAVTPGKIVEIFAEQGDSVSQTDRLFLIQKKEGEFAFFSFAPIERGQQLQPGMQAYIKPESVDTRQYGSIQATIQSIAPYVATEGELKLLLGSNVLIRHLTENLPVLIVMIAPQKDEKTPSGLKWTSGTGPPKKIAPLTLGSALIILESKHPISYVIPLWKVKKLSYETGKP